MTRGESKGPPDLTKVSVLWGLVYMGLPSMIGFGALTIYGLTDIFWVGRLGTPQVAAVTLFGAVAWVLSTVNQLVGQGSVAVIARRTGARDPAAAAAVIQQTFLLKLIIGLVFAGIGLALLEPMLWLMNARGDVRHFGLEYGRPYLLGLPFVFASYTVFTSLRAVGDAPKAMALMLLTTGLNVVLDPIMMFGFEQGVAGAAQATVLSSATGLVLGLRLLASGRARVVVPFFGKARLDARVIRQIVEVGGPVGLSGLALSVSHWVISALLMVYGSALVAAFGIVLRLGQLPILFAIGFQAGANAIVGQSLGASDPGRARTVVATTTVLTAVVAGLLGAIAFLWPRPIVSLFTDDPEVIVEAVPILLVFAGFQLMTTVSIALTSAFYGSGDTWPPTLITLGTRLGVLIPACYACVELLALDVIAVWISLLAAAGLELLLTGAVFFRRDWQARVL